MIPGVLLLVLLLGINALYVAAEFAFVGLGRTRAARGSETGTCASSS